MTGKEAIEWYLKEYGYFTCELVAESTGVKKTAIQGAAHKMRAAGEIMLDKRVWRSNFYVPAPEEDEDKPIDRSGVNTIFDECRHNWQGYQVHKIFGSHRQGVL
ncbi:hypothetical protein [Kosakonia oryziphila]|uniref:Winged helix-turn-helix DNA-binding n=1 Tax=Kosakonia oryziphila TaxID=1005667 RepID=A0A1C4GBV2_9ENTR|nr:hypothetical protein [Kosakonia oryziphila]SCC65616.1 hypothetical protein GA0061070_106110 [Kosakonia oryziphila]